VDRKSAKDILQTDVKKLASKQIFARWQTILSEYLQGSENDLPDYFTREYL
jgi:hypothetical protein